MKLFTPAETVANYAAAGAVKTKQPFLKLLLLGVAAGMLIGFPVCVTNMATYTVANPARCGSSRACCSPSDWAL